jgi:3-hydroxyisobutyrate dehydrogenase-like beta-hydroxyacid dehydrogenase
MTGADIALIGYGEVGAILAHDLEAHGTTTTVFDTSPAAWAPASTRAAPTAHAVIRDAGIVVVSTMMEPTAPR